MIDKPVKECGEHSGATPTENWMGNELGLRDQELAFIVSYKTMRTLMVWTAPGVEDPTVKLNLQWPPGAGSTQHRLVVYMIVKKYVRYLGKVRRNTINHFVGV